MFTATLVLATLTADGRPRQAPRPPQYPAAGAVVVIVTPCNITGCACGCANGEVCRCATTSAPVYVQPPPVMYYRPAYQPMFFNGGGSCSGGG